jgi:probable rRNA maturation factor
MDVPRKPDRLNEAETDDPDPRQRLLVDVVIDSDLWSSLPGAEASIQKAAAALGRHARLHALLPVSACVALADDEAVQELNASYRGQDKPTNVLSFPAAAPPVPLSAAEADTGPPIGDIILAYETIMREARELGVSPEHHVEHLAIHGLLHLFGFDHEEDDMAEDMESIETAVLATIGVADPYQSTHE